MISFMIDDDECPILQIISGGIQLFLQLERHLLLFIRIIYNKDRSSSAYLIFVHRHHAHGKPAVIHIQPRKRDQRRLSFVPVNAHNR